jgi:D-aminoacyl-tRNA deacylase
MKDFLYNFKSQSLCLIASTKDVASITIAKEVENLGLKVFYLRNKSHLDCQEIELPESDNYIILSRHTSATNTPALTVHSVGNFSPEEPKFGGKASLLSFTNADLQADLLRILLSMKKDIKMLESFDVVAEVTHHGPYMDKPTVYIEMGSSEEVWTNSNYGYIIAKAILQLINGDHDIPKEGTKTGIAFGGPHYAVKFTKLMLEEKINIGHICAKYSLPYLDENLIQQMITKTIGQNKVEYAFFEKKGMKRKLEIKKMLLDLNLDIIQI